MLAQGLHRLGVAPEQPTWHRVNGEWVRGTSASILQAEKTVEEAMAGLRRQWDDLSAEVQERNKERLREAILKMQK